MRLGKSASLGIIGATVILAALFIGCGSDDKTVTPTYLRWAALDSGIDNYGMSFRRVLDPATAGA